MSIKKSKLKGHYLGVYLYSDESIWLMRHDHVYRTRIAKRVVRAMGASFSYQEYLERDTLAMAMAGQGYLPPIALWCPAVGTQEAASGHLYPGAQPRGCKKGEKERLGALDTIDGKLQR